MEMQIKLNQDFIHIESDLNKERLNLETILLEEIRIYYLVQETIMVI